MNPIATFTRREIRPVLDRQLAEYGSETPGLSTAAGLPCLTFGERFDLRAFNDTLMLGGRVPLDVLGQNVEAFILATG